MITNVQPGPAFNINASTSAIPFFRVQFAASDRRAFEASLRYKDGQLRLVTSFNSLHWHETLRYNSDDPVDIATALHVLDGWLIGGWQTAANKEAAFDVLTLQHMNEWHALRDVPDANTPSQSAAVAILARKLHKGLLPNDAANWQTLAQHINASDEETLRAAIRTRLETLHAVGLYYVQKALDSPACVWDGPPLMVASEMEAHIYWQSLPRPLARDTGSRTPFAIRNITETPPIPWTTMQGRRVDIGASIAGSHFDMGLLANAAATADQDDAEWNARPVLVVRKMSHFSVGSGGWSTFLTLCEDGDYRLLEAHYTQNDITSVTLREV